MPLSHPLRLRATQHPDRGTEWPLGLPIPLLRHLQDRSLTAVARLSPGEDVSFVRTEPVSRRPAQLVSTADHWLGQLPPHGGFQIPPSPGWGLSREPHPPAVFGFHGLPQHCQDPCDLDQLDLFSVLLGAWQLQNPGPRSQQVGIAWVLPHPGYSWKEAARADIALVRLKHTIQFSERVLPICLPDFSVQLPPNTSCWIAGWGSISDGVPLPYPQTLQKLKVPIIDSEVCSRLYWRGAGQDAITEDMLCAGYLEGKRDACMGDSGGPLMCRVNGAWLLAGIISWGEGCAERNRPGVYTSLLVHRSWVQRVVRWAQLHGHKARGTGAQGAGPS
ncbi:brain-specific serine protease 4 isoform X3 [Fukomys damarensis]|uniref:brain-specific serine protease 4 isoform X3 n=1 Tax=Fukomys damarensis TaxID=885580 RepID=UPI00053FBA20|nr:brain-specific serine protease 4 isoform X3 [Fukomys damarensis]